MVNFEDSPSENTPISAHNLNKMQTDIVEDMSKIHIGTNITASTIEGCGRINKLFGTENGVGKQENMFKGTYTSEFVIDTANSKISAGNSTIVTAVVAINANTKYKITKDKGERLIVAETSAYPQLGMSCNILFTNGSDMTIKECTVTTSATAKYLVIYLSYSALTDIVLNVIEQNKYKVEIISKNGDKTSSNICYIKTPLCSMNTELTDVLDYTSKKVTRKCGYLVLNGSENWIGEASVTTDSNCISFYRYLPEMHKPLDTETNCSCNSFKAVSRTDASILAGECVGMSNSGSFFITILRSKLVTKDIAGLKSYLALNNAIVVYQLQNETEEEIECSGKIVQFADTTNIYNTDNAEIEVSLTNNKAIADTNANLSRIEESIIKAGGKILWSNPNPLLDFASQLITLASNDYNFLEIYFLVNIEGTLLLSNKFLKGYGTALVFFGQHASDYPSSFSRKIARNSDISFSIDTCYRQKTNANTKVEFNSYCIPVCIKGG